MFVNKTSIFGEIQEYEINVWVLSRKKIAIPLVHEREYLCSYRIIDHNNKNFMTLHDFVRMSAN